MCHWFAQSPAKQMLLTFGGKKRLWTAQPVFKMSICRFLSAVSCLEFAVGEENLHSSDGKGQKSENMD